MEKKKPERDTSGDCIKRRNNMTSMSGKDKTGLENTQCQCKTQEDKTKKKQKQQEKHDDTGQTGIGMGKVGFFKLKIIAAYF
jgi:hypothetical protein